MEKKFMEKEVNSMTDKILIDTNVLVYGFENSDKFKQEKSMLVIEKSAVENNVFVSVQNMAELARVLTEKVKIKVPANITQTYLLKMGNLFRRIFYDEFTIMNALDISEKYKLHFFDALLVATMKENGIKTIITENDKDFEKIPFIKAVNPFRN